MNDLTLLLCMLATLKFASPLRLHGFKSRPGEALDLYAKHPFRKTPRSYVVTEGQKAVLECAPTDLEGRTVIWKRVQSSEPLTVDLESFYNGERIVAQHVPHDNKWNLVIHDVRLDDAGMYECQISSQQKSLREHCQLIVREKPEETTPSPEKSIKVTGTSYAEKGEMIHLICSGKGVDHPPPNIDWFLNGNKLSSRSNKIRIKDYVDYMTQTVVSTLEIEDAQHTDIGNYVCRTSNLHIASLYVTVLNSDTNNKKRGTIPGDPDTESSQNKRDPGRQDGLSSDDKNSAPAQNAISVTSFALCVSMALVLLCHRLFPR